MKVFFENPAANNPWTVETRASEYLRMGLLVWLKKWNRSVRVSFTRWTNHICAAFRYF